MTRAAADVTLRSTMLDTEPQIRRFSIDDVYKMDEAGVLGPEERVELIDGVLYELMAPSYVHSDVVAWLTQHFVGAVGDLQVRIQDMLIVDGGFVMPDLMVIERPRGEQPSAAALVIEVSVSTKRHDRAKADRYARSNVEEYWIVDPEEGCVVVHRDPGGGRFTTITRYSRSELVPTSVGAPPVDVAALLGASG